MSNEQVTDKKDPASLTSEALKPPMSYDNVYLEVIRMKDEEIAYLKSLVDRLLGVPVRR